MKLFTGSANVELAKKVAEHLHMELGKIMVGTFSDGEIMIELMENVRGQEIFIIQPTCAPTNNNIMELVIMADAMHRASAKNITAVIPYFGYARQDRRVHSLRVPISAKVVADILQSSGIARVITVDLHAEQIQGFFSIPVDNVYGSAVMFEDMKNKGLKNMVIVSPDVGGVVRARAIAKRFNDSDLAIIDKRRQKRNQVEVMNIIGEIEGRDCVIIDDIIDTAGTICQAANALRSRGARSVTVYGTHPVLSCDAISNIEKSQITEVVVTDTIPLSAEAMRCKKIRQLTISALLAETINRVNNKGSLSLLFPD